jgi:hypothetical protein
MSDGPRFSEWYGSGAKLCFAIGSPKSLPSALSTGRTIRGSYRERCQHRNTVFTVDELVGSNQTATRLPPAGPNVFPRQVGLTVSGRDCAVEVEPRTPLLDALRGALSLTGTKKGCDRGECGACTVHVDGRGVLSCMSLAAMQEGKRITTIEGLGQHGELHPVQAAFIEQTAFNSASAPLGRSCRQSP